MGRHPDVSAPVAAHLLSTFYPLRSLYGSLSDRTNMNRLLADMLSVANHPYHDWNLELDVDSVASEASSVITAVDLLYGQMAGHSSKHYYFSKEIRTCWLIDQLRAEVPRSKFVHLVRDPRDHVASWMARPISLYTPLDAVIEWKRQQAEIIDAIRGRNLHCVIVRYEDLIAETVKTMNTILDYLALSRHERCYQTDSTNRESSRNPYWENLSRPVMKENSAKYLAYLNEEDVQLVETVAAEEMDFYGYVATTRRDWRISRRYLYRYWRARARGKRAANINLEKNMAQLQDKGVLIKSIRRRLLEESGLQSAELKSLLSGLPEMAIANDLIRALTGKCMVGSALLSNVFKRTSS